MAVKDKHKFSTIDHLQKTMNAMHVNLEVSEFSLSFWKKGVQNDDMLFSPWIKD